MSKDEIVFTPDMQAAIERIQTLAERIQRVHAIAESGLGKTITAPHTTETGTILRAFWEIMEITK